MNIDVVTVVGANGTMGRNIAAIFASFGNAKVYLVSRTLEKSIQAREKACLSVKADSIREKMIPSDYDDLENCIMKSDLVFEACSESWDVKRTIHTQIANILCKNEYATPGSTLLKIICTGTSGLSITSLAELYDELHYSRFLGMHFFNPPYNMTLCELIPTKYSDNKLFQEVYDYTQNYLNRTTVKTKDTPAFLGNRIGFQFINEALQYAEQYKYSGGIDYIDAILGPFTGRAMAPMVTANFVGLDVHKAIVDNIFHNTNDYAHKTFILPQFVNQLISEGRLGRKTGSGLYKTVVDDEGVKKHQVYDIEHRKYREINIYSFPFVKEMVNDLKVGDYKEAFKKMMSNHSQEAEICCQFLLKYILYSLHAAIVIADDLYACDDVMATGFNWCPPLALIEALGGVEIFISICEQRIDSALLERMNFRDLLKNLGKSKYDYRRFIKAKP